MFGDEIIQGGEVCVLRIGNMSGHDLHGIFVKSPDQIQNLRKIGGVKIG